MTFETSESVFDDAPTEIGVGASDAFLLVVSIAGFFILAGLVYSIIILRLKSSEEIEKEETKTLDYNEQLAKADVSTLNRAQRRARARHIMKQQRRVEPANTNDNNNHDDPNLDPAAAEPEPHQEPRQLLLQDHGEEIRQEPEQQQQQQQHLSRKERQKAAKAAEREERRLFEEDRQRQQQAVIEAAQRDKKLREKEREERAEQERKLKIEQKKAEELAEYEKWKTFLVSPDGSKKKSVKEWRLELEDKKVMLVHEMAAEFELTPDLVSERIRTLLATARITGVLEPDGRFIYISEAQMRSIATFIQEQEVVSILEVAKGTEDVLCT